MNNATIKIETLDNGKIAVTSPFNRTFIADAKTRLAGRWNPAKKAWTFDPANEERVRDLVRRIYGLEDSEEDIERVTVTVDMSEWEDFKGLQVGGVRVIERYHRDRAPRLAENVTVLSGGFSPSGGSMANPRFGKNNAVIEIREVPITAVRDWMTVVTPADEQINKLEARAKTLRAELAKIEAQLQGLKAGAAA